MGDLSAKITLRPTRIALLVSPSDKASVRRFMRICACLWGGVYNPIIPVFTKTPAEWRSDFPANLSGREIALGYVNFFEPDIFIEAKPKMLERIGLGGIRSEYGIEKQVFSLDEFLCPQPHRDWSELAAGLGIIDALRDVYGTERRFKLRDERPAILVKPSAGSAVVEAIFGAYPDEGPAAYIRNAYHEVYKPVEMAATPDTLRTVIFEGAQTPLRATRHKLETARSWQHDPVVFVFDPRKNTDLIDLWNLRLEPAPVLPVPIKWWSDLVDDIKNTISEQYRPLQGNPNGIMHGTTIEFARSLGDVDRTQAIELLSNDLPKGAWVSKHWRNRIWEERSAHRIPRLERLKVTAQEKRLSLDVDDNHPPTTEFPTLSPDFAAMYGGGHHARWINVVRFSHSRKHNIATVLPFNISDRSWPRLGRFGESVMVGREGWCFPQQYKDASEGIQLHSHEDIVIGSLKRLGVEAKLSAAGHIAKQALHHLNGLWGVYLLKDQETLSLMNSMASGLRRRVGADDISEEIFERKSKPESEWRSLMARRRKRRDLPEITISNFTERQVLRLGIATSCPHCTAANWHSLDTADYSLVCERCLKRYSFPQGSLDKGNGNWAYRVIGPFATPDYAQGSYGAMLALNVLNGIGFDRDAMTFSSALTLKIDSGNPCEADYVAWCSAKAIGDMEQPTLVFGEAKSFGEGDLVKAKDIDQLTRIAGRFPGAVIVISVMRDFFTESEKEILRSFVQTCRKPDGDRQPRNPVILLTGIELFHDISISATWKAIGDRHAEFANHENTRSLRSLAEATQSIYLDMPSFYHDQQTKPKRKRKSKNAG